MTVAYPSELTSDQCELLLSLLPASKPGGRPRPVNLERVIQGILYILVAGCAWRLLPKEYPPRRFITTSVSGAMMALGSEFMTNSSPGVELTKTDIRVPVQEASILGRFPQR